MREILISGVSSRHGCEQLIRDDLNLGGSDNITAIVARVASVELDRERTVFMSADGDSQQTLEAACSRVAVPFTNSLPALATV